MNLFTRFYDSYHHASPNWRRMVFVLCGFTLLGGCVTETSKPAQPSPTVTVRSTPQQAPAKQQVTTPAAQAPSKQVAAAHDPNLDPCAIRLHDLSGPLLLYYSSHLRFPDSLDDLKAMPGFSDIGPFVCPVSNQPYDYTPDGVPSPDDGWFIILADSTPAHDGLRWAVSIRKPELGGSLVTKVIILTGKAPPK